MTPADIEALALELNFEVEYNDDGEIVLFTGVIDETRRIDPDIMTQQMTLDFGEEDEDDVIDDPYTT
ncbi:hypothetical protein OAA09_01480 [bacterium]|nr:hypothetical protein [bacterium]